MCTINHFLLLLYRLCAVVVVRGQILPDSDLTIYNDAVPHDNSASYYITAAWGESEIYSSQVPQMIIIGNNSVYIAPLNSESTTFINVPLKANTEYSFFTRYDIKNELNDNEVKI